MAEAVQNLYTMIDRREKKKDEPTPERDGGIGIASGSGWGLSERTSAEMWIGWDNAWLENGTLR